MNFNESNIITLKIKIKSLSNEKLIDDKIYMYTGCYNYLYKCFEQVEDKDFLNEIKLKFNINEIEIRSIVNQIKIKKDIEIINNRNKLNRIEELYKAIESSNNPKNIFKWTNKIEFLKKSVKNNDVFGKRSLLQSITKDANKGIRNPKKIKEWKESRKRKIFIIGEANYKGNRFIDFDLVNNLIIYKPSINQKCLLELHKYKDKNIDFNKLQYLIDNKEISITTKINKEYVCLTFDLNSYLGINQKLKEIKTNLQKEIKEKNILDKQIIKDMYSIEYKKLEEQLSIKKIKNRYCSIDMNPDGIGISIFDSKNYKQIFLEKFYIDYSKNNLNLKLSSDHESNLKQTNKRKAEILYSLSRLFDKLRHYKVYNFVMEELNFTDIDGKRITNRKINNVWNKELIIKKIKKEICLSNMNLIEVNPVYTSFIGNIQHEEFDPIAASIEIGRRGSLKYRKGSFYPKILIKDIDTLESIIGKSILNDAQDLNDLNWKLLYNSSNKFRWRRSLSNFNYEKIRIGNKLSKTYLIYKLYGSDKEVNHIHPITKEHVKKELKEHTRIVNLYKLLY